MQQKDPYLFHLSYDTGLYFDWCSLRGPFRKIRGFVGGDSHYSGRSHG